jgi:hypothetical protein
MPTSNEKKICKTVDFLIFLTTVKYYKNIKANFNGCKIGNSKPQYPGPDLDKEHNFFWKMLGLDPYMRNTDPQPCPFLRFQVRIHKEYR